MTAKETIEQIIELDEKIAELRESLAATPVEEQERELVGRFDSLLGEAQNEGNISIRMIRVAEMLVGLESPAAARCVSKGIVHGNEDVTMLCADVFLHLAATRFEMVMPVIEDALKEDGDLAEELPFLLVDVESDHVTPVISRFLNQKNGDVVASAVQALAELGDPAAVPELTKLLNDERLVTADAEDMGTEKWTVGQMAKDAIEMLSDEED